MRTRWWPTGIGVVVALVVALLTGCGTVSSTVARAETPRTRVATTNTDATTARGRRSAGRRSRSSATDVADTTTATTTV